jgi:alpha-N-arabinofuranosidase
MEIEDVIKKHCAIMDEADPKKNIALLVDEWGTWWDEEPGTIGGHLYQQNAMRDAFVAALTLNIFHKYTDRVKMANIAQVVNVLQSMILTDTKGTGHMVLTPTYHVFEMYKPFQEATFLPISVNRNYKLVRHDMNKEMDAMNKEGYRVLPLLDASAAKTTKGSIVVSLTNVSLNDAQEVSIDLNGFNGKSVSGRILTSDKVSDYNDFEHPNRVQPTTFSGAKLKNGKLTAKIPAKSIVVLELQ